MIGYKNGATSLYLAKREGKDLLYVGKAGTGFTNSGALGSQSLEVRKVTRRYPSDAGRQAHRLGFTFLGLGDLPPPGRRAWGRLATSGTPADTRARSSRQGGNGVPWRPKMTVYLSVSLVIHTDPSH